VLVTRPGERAANLARLVEQAGGRAFLFPAIEIEDLPPPAALGVPEAERISPHWLRHAHASHALDGFVAKF